MDRLEKQRKLIQWRNDLERRLANHICDGNPRDTVKLELPIDVEALKKLRRDDKPKLKIEVLESLTVQGAWEVYANGRMVSYYSGPNSHEKASKKASDIANEV